MNEQFECACDVPIICQFAVTQTLMSLRVFFFTFFWAPRAHSPATAAGCR